MNEDLYMIIGIAGGIIVIIMIFALAVLYVKLYERYRHYKLKKEKEEIDIYTIPKQIEAPKMKDNLADPDVLEMTA